MTPELTQKTSQLLELIKTKKSAAVAFSGGVDSSFLAKMVFEALGENSLAITLDSMFIPRAEISQAKRTAEFIGIKHKIIDIKELPEDVLNNDKRRCYKCKKTLFSILLEDIEKKGIKSLFDGSNLDDLSDYRPGMEALKELKVESPLLACKFTKQDIRDASKSLGLETWDHPSMACLASRIPYDTAINSQDLAKVEKAEDFLKSLGFGQLRVRCHFDLARIEIHADDRDRMFDITLMEKISRQLKTYGFKYVALDLEGYQTGSLNN